MRLSDSSRLTLFSPMCFDCLLCCPLYSCCVSVYQSCGSWVSVYYLRVWVLFACLDSSIPYIVEGDRHSCSTCVMLFILPSQVDASMYN